ncbi:MAG: DUF4130 domain-containing protein [Desulfuromonadaceae bacterium]|nr:DUF4130 domain-containing protein [Desulfuromonadaceae bacterium]
MSGEEVSFIGIPDAEPNLTVSEHDYAALWQRYFQRHAIAERHNPKLQHKHVPLRYR